MACAKLLLENGAHVSPGLVTITPGKIIYVFFFFFPIVIIRIVSGFLRNTLRMSCK